MKGDPTKERTCRHDPAPESEVKSLLFFKIKVLKLQAACWCRPAGRSLLGRGQRASNPYSCRSCYTGGSGRTEPCLAPLKHSSYQREASPVISAERKAVHQRDGYLDFHLRSQSLSLCGSEGPCRGLRLPGCPPRSADGPTARR